MDGEKEGGLGVEGGVEGGGGEQGMEVGEVGDHNTSIATPSAPE